MTTSRTAPVGGGAEDDDGAADGVIVDTSERPPVESTQAAGRRWTSERVALWVFVAYLVFSFFYILHLGSYRWFLGDEWDFLAARSATNLDDLFSPHNQHWSTVPLLMYRALYSVFGVRTYLPYQIPVAVSHLTMCGLIRVILRRMGVGAWLASISAATLVLFGLGQDDIIWAFQIGFSLAVVLALTQFILADHPGPITRRDWLGLGAGLLALMCSGQAPPVILATGIAVLLKRGWRQALFHSVPLGAIYLAWYKVEDAGLKSLVDKVPAGQQVPTLDASAAYHWYRSAVQSIFDGLGHYRVLAILLGVMLVVGWALAWITTDWPTFRRRAALPAALLIGCIAGSTATMTQRFFFNSDQASRYLMINVALCLPAFVFAAQVIIERWRWTTPAVFAVFLIPIIPNATDFDQGTGLTGPLYYQNVKSTVAAFANSPLLAATPDWVNPNVSIQGMPGMSVGYLKQAKAEGKLPTDAVPLDPAGTSQLPVRFGVATVDGSADGFQCQTYSKPLELKPNMGDRWLFHGDLNISTAKGGKRTSFPVDFSDAAQGNLVQISVPNLDLLLEPTQSGSFQLCMPGT